MDKTFNNQTVLVTGAGGSVGREVSKLFASEGARIVCVGRSYENINQTAEMVGNDSFAIKCDISNHFEVGAVVDQCLSIVDNIDILINIAGTGHFCETHKETPESFDEIIKTNLSGTFYFCRYVLPHMLERKNGQIINTASSTANAGFPWSAAYTASKAGIVQMTKAMAYEYREHGIRINAISAGAIANSFGAEKMTIPDGANFQLIMKYVSSIPPANVSEVANLYMTIAKNRLMVGSVLIADSGITC